MTVYRRPDPIPRRRAEPGALKSPALQAVRSEPDDLHHLVARKIHAAIANGDFPEGSILPNEFALGNSLGVSRTALREAIKGLASKGMVETRRRRGTMVLDRSHWTQVDGEVITWSRKENESLVSEELWQMVSAVLPSLAAAVAGKRTRPGQAMPVFASVSERVGWIADFLTGLARKAQNRFLFSIVSIGLTDLREHDPDFLALRLAGFDAEAFGDLTAALASGNCSAASSAMTSLLNRDVQAMAVAQSRSTEQL